MAASLKYTLHHYGTQHELQRVGVWEVDPADKGNYWVIYIHGGAWRDPRVTHEVFTPSIDRILSSPSTESKASRAIAGFASIDYRLSPHPQFPQDPTTTPVDQFRAARHPDHLNDIRAALVFLQQTYGFGSNYVLIGHSAGGALVFQLPASVSTPASASSEAGKHPDLPAAVVALEGLYDFRGINERYKGAYTLFFRGAFGDDPESWDAAAPIKFSGNYADNWPSGKLVLIGWSPDDTLIDGPEADNMARRLLDLDEFVEEKLDDEGEEESGNKGKKRLLLLKDLQGEHDEIWRSGEHVARTALIALRKLGAGS
ncbi:alpha/beta-hydrolase [Nemania sp. FL0916]|nr:alpha/beta-hydrolase [Nemania sp. FL0916]